MEVTPKPEKKFAHLVLSAGGAQTLSYIGAIRELQARGVEFKSISCCSSGSIIGALLAAKVDLKELEELLLMKGLKEYSRKPKLPGLLKWLNLLKFPFAVYDSANTGKLFEELLHREIRMSDLELDFATIGIDIYRNRFIVFSKETVPEMPVSKILDIALAVPVLTTPYQPAGHRLIIDAGVAISSPVWLTARHDDDLPIIVLRPQASESYRHKANIFRFVYKIFVASANSWDWYQIQNEPRVRVIDINCGGIRQEDYGMSSESMAFLFDQGQQAICSDYERIWQSNPPLPKPEPPGALTGIDLGESRANEWNKKFGALMKAKRNQIFISYNPADEEWLEQLQRFLRPLQKKYGLLVWSERSVTPGRDVEKAIAEALETTRLAILLVSVDYLGDDMFHDEAQYLIAEAQKDQIELLWVLVGPCDYQDFQELKAIKPAFPPTQALSELPGEASREAAWKEVVRVVRERLVE